MSNKIHKHKCNVIKPSKNVKIKHGHFPVYRISSNAWTILLSSSMNNFQRAFDACKRIHLLCVYRGVFVLWELLTLVSYIMIILSSIV